MRWLTLLLTAILLILPSHGAAQRPVELERLTVSFWPEYDRRAVLVIYQAQLPAEIELPTQVPLPIPSEVGTPHAVANVTENGGLVNAPYEMSEEGAWAVVSVQAQSGRVWVEYYADLAVSGQDRQFTYRWPGTVAVDSFEFEVQRPPGTSEMQIAPAPAGERTDGQGLTYLTGGLGSLAAGEAASVEVSYSRTTEELTVDLRPDPAPQLDQETVDPGGEIAWGTYAALAVAILLLASGSYLLWVRPRTSRARTRRRRRAPARGTDRERRFCYNCGLEADPDDRFCRRCGTKLRTPD